MQGLVTCLQVPGKPPHPLPLPPPLPPSPPSLPPPSSLTFSSSVPFDLQISAPSLLTFSLSSCFDQQRRPNQRRRWVSLGLEKHNSPSSSHRCESSAVGSGGFPPWWQGFQSHELDLRVVEESAFYALADVCSVLSNTCEYDKLFVLPPADLSSSGNHLDVAAVTAGWPAYSLSMSIVTTLASYATTTADLGDLRDNELSPGAAAAILAAAVIWVSSSNSTREHQVGDSEPGRAGCGRIGRALEGMTVDNSGGWRTSAGERCAGEERVGAAAAVASHSGGNCVLYAESATNGCWSRSAAEQSCASGERETPATQTGGTCGVYTESVAESTARTGNPTPRRVAEAEVASADVGDGKGGRERGVGSEVSDQRLERAGQGTESRVAANLAESSIPRDGQGQKRAPLEREVLPGEEEGEEDDLEQPVAAATTGAVLARGGASCSRGAGGDPPPQVLATTEGLALGGESGSGRAGDVFSTISIKSRSPARKSLARSEVIKATMDEHEDERQRLVGEEMTARGGGRCTVCPRDTGQSVHSSGSQATVLERGRSGVGDVEGGGGHELCERLAAARETLFGGNRNEQSAAAQSAVVRVLQWNTLADGLAQTGDFVKAPTAALEWAGRSPLLLREILRADADFICLQEVNHFDDFFAPKLRDRTDGYAGFFHPKMASPARRFGFNGDGCAIFYRRRRFHCVEMTAMNYVDSSTATCHNQGLQMCVFEERSSGDRLIIANTHLKAGEGNETVRVSQAEQMLRALEQIGNRYPDAPVVICGDFNAPPDSEVCARMRSNLMGLRSAYAYIADCEECQVATGADGGPHSIGTSSSASLSRCGEERGGGCLEFLCVCTMTSRDGGAGYEPPFTTWKFRSGGEKRATIDYIWYADDCGVGVNRTAGDDDWPSDEEEGTEHGQEGGENRRSRSERLRRVLRPRQRWRLPDERVIGMDALPSSSFPSDHLPLMCEFEWTPKCFHDKLPLHVSRPNGDGGSWPLKGRREAAQMTTMGESMVLLRGERK